MICCCVPVIPRSMIYKTYIPFIGDRDGLPVDCFVFVFVCSFEFVFVLQCAMCSCETVELYCQWSWGWFPTSWAGTDAQGARDGALFIRGAPTTPLALQHHICLYGEHLQHHIGATTPYLFIRGAPTTPHWRYTTPYLFIRGAATTPCLDYHTRATTPPMVYPDFHKGSSHRTICLPTTHKKDTNYHDTTEVPAE